MDGRSLSSRTFALLLLIAGLTVLTTSALYSHAHFRNMHYHFYRHTSSDVDTISDWMTVPYISRNYGVPEPVLLNALGVNRFQARRSLAEIARLHHARSSTVVETVRSTILQYRSHPAATPVPAPGLSGQTLQ